MHGYPNVKLQNLSEILLRTRNLGKMWHARSTAAIWMLQETSSFRFLLSRRLGFTQFPERNSVPLSAVQYATITWLHKPYNNSVLGHLKQLHLHVVVPITSVMYAITDVANQSVSRSTMLYSCMIYMFGPSQFSTFRLLLWFPVYAAFTTWKWVGYEVSPQDLQTKLIGHIIFLN